MDWSSWLGSLVNLILMISMKTFLELSSNYVLIQYSVYFIRFSSWDYFI